MSEYYEEMYDVAVTFYQGMRGTPWAEVRAHTFPDGSVKNKLDPDELRELAEMLDTAADELEERTDAE